MTTAERINNWKVHDSQRGIFGFELYKTMAKDENVWLVTGDLGYGLFDAHREDFPDRFINTGAAEQAMMGIAVGLALKGKKVFVYSITPFLLRRPYETIKLYLDHEKIPVILVGGGRDKDYAHDGISHDASDTAVLLATFPNIYQYWPEDKAEVPDMVSRLLESDTAAFISLTR